MRLLLLRLSEGECLGRAERCETARLRDAKPEEMDSFKGLEANSKNRALAPCVSLVSYPLKLGGRSQPAPTALRMAVRLRLVLGWAKFSSKFSRRWTNSSPRGRIWKEDEFEGRADV